MNSARIDPVASLLADNDVVRRVIAGEKSLFEILMRRNNQKLYRIVRSYLRDEEEIRDVMQNTYLKAFDKLSQFHGDAAFSTWLIRIGINEALMRIKDIKKTKVLYLNSDHVDAEKLNHIPDKQVSIEKQIIKQEMQQVLEHAIDGLPEKYRVVYVMKEVEGMENLQVAGILGISEANVKVRLHRARAIIKDLLLKFTEGADVFGFGNSRCDALVEAVMKSI